MRLIFKIGNSWHNLGRSLKNGKDAAREGREGHVNELVHGEPKHGGVQAQGEVWVHFSGPEQLRVRLEKWAEATLISNQWVHR